MKFRDVTDADREALERFYETGEDADGFNNYWIEKYGYTIRVQKVFDFIENLIVPSGKGSGEPFVLQDFEKAFIRDIYDPIKNGKRVIRRAILSIARKNGKSTIIAALALVHLVGPEAIRNGEIYTAATERDQAAIVFRYAAQMVRADPELEQFIKIVDSTKTMICFGNGSLFRALSAEAGSKYGFNPSVVIYDELAQAKTRDLYDALDTSMAAREEPLMIVISTQSDDPQHILSQLIDDGLSGKDETTVCHLYAVPEKAKDIYDDPGLWKLANPALGIFRSLEEMEIAAKRAKRMPSFEAAFRNLYLNQRVKVENPLISRTEWQKCKKPLKIKKGEDIYLGLDLSGKHDLTALVGVSAGVNDIVRAWFWKPKDTLKDHERRDRVPYSVWEKKGVIEAPPGRVIQFDFVARKLAEIAATYNVLGVAFDRWRIDDFLNALSRLGIDAYVEGKDSPRGLRMVPWGQGYKDMGPAVDALEVAVLNGSLAHDGNPCLTWNVANAMPIKDPAGNRKLDKSKTRFRIDGAVAMVMALGLKSRDKKVELRSGYEDVEKIEILAF